jgi:hypothetical protein
MATMVTSSGDQILGTLHYLIPLLTVSVSTIYFISQPRASAPICTRLLTSVHGLSIALIFLVFWALATTPAARYTSPLVLLLTLVPLALFVPSLMWFKGPRLIHLFQLVNVACLSLALLYGALFTGGPWT